MWFGRRSARWLLDHNSCQEAARSHVGGVGGAGYGPTSMPSRPERRTRVTLRCLREDLEVEVPPVEIDLGGLDHPLIGEARRLTPAAPRGQKRILSIERPLAYRLRHGRWRGATYLETEAGRFWLCAGAQREAGSGEDAYEIFAALHRAGRHRFGRGGLGCDRYSGDRRALRRGALARRALRLGPGSC
jgi:hypothetical protein